MFTHRQFYVGVPRVISRLNIKAIWEPNKKKAKIKNIVYSEVLLK